MKRAAWMGGFVVGLAVLAAARPTGGGSIWARANATGMTPRIYEDDTARRAGDIVTIVINEKSTIDNDTKRTNDKKSDRSLTASGTVNLKDLTQWWGKRADNNFTLPSVSATSAASSKFEGNAKLEAERTITDKITVTVHDVLPNGNLVVLGSRRRNVDGDVQYVCVSGVVRPSDITFTNTVNSEQVADFNMVTIVKGPETTFAQPGWLGRIMNFLSPW
jgi:flagellar L-ring protein precursor FlgH